MTDILARIQQDLAAGRFPSAIKKARLEAKKRPDSAAVQNVAGICLGMSGDHAGSIPFFLRAARAEPGNADYHCNLILACAMSGETAKASSAIAAAEKAGVSGPRLDHLRALTCLRNQDVRGAVRWANAALAAAPGMVDALNVRASALTDLNRLDEALADFDAILAVEPDNVTARENSAERLAELGRREEARDRFRSVLRFAPGHPFALSRLADLEPKDDLPGLLAQIDAGLRAKPRGQVDKVMLHMAAGTAHDRLGDTSLAMDHFDKAHDLDARMRPWRAAAARKEFERVAAWFRDPVTPAATDAGPRPIFVVGLPRSGTTLVERILSASEAVFACGELTSAARRVAQCFGTEGPTPQALRAFAEGYRADLPDLPSGTRAFVDKMPDNYRCVGFLLAAFPDARVVHVSRDPRDCALSMWKQRFPADSMNYASRLGTLAEEANLYRSYMRLWSSVCGDRLATFRYEDIVADPEGQTRRLAAHCGIDWAEAMLRPDQSDAPARTASLIQVRQQVHTRSIGGWRAQADRLRGFTAGLDRILWDPDFDLSGD